MAEKKKKTEKKKPMQGRRKKRTVLSPSHTKGYYRFSKQFPSVTDSDGYRDNELFVNSNLRKAKIKRNLALIFAAVFIVSFCVTALCVSISKVPVAEGGEDASQASHGVADFNGYKAVFLSGEVLSSDNIGSLSKTLMLQDINTVVIEFKSPSGYVYFKPESSVSSEALYNASANAKDVVKKLKDAGFGVFASFSCFADDIYARNNAIDAAYITPESTPENEYPDNVLWYDDTAEPHAWINPYSYLATGYITSLIYEISGMGVDGIIFTDVMLPESADGSKLIFENKLSSETLSVNEKMYEYIAYMKSTIGCKVGVQLRAENLAAAALENRTEEMYCPDFDFIVLDARISSVPENIAIGEKIYLKPEKTPKEFLSAIISETKKYLNENECGAELIPLLETTQVDQESKAMLLGNNIMSYIEQEKKAE